MKNELKKIRKKNNLNTAQLGSMLGVSGRTVENWEQGRLVPQTVIILVKVLQAKGEL